MTVPGVNVPNGTLVVADAVSHAARTLTFHGVRRPSDLLANHGDGPLGLAAGVQVLSNARSTGRTEHPPCNLDREVLVRQKIGKVLVVVVHDLFIVPVCDLPLEDLRQKAARHVKSTRSVRHSWDIVKQRDGPQNEGQMHNADPLVLHRLVLRTRNRDITCSEIIVRHVRSNSRVVHPLEFPLAGGGTDSAVREADGQFGAVHEGLHVEPDALGRVGGARSVDREDLTAVAPDIMRGHGEGQEGESGGGPLHRVSSLFGVVGR
mmetsp:Transcript_38681/g.78900  ORF Transcript_38681/g.78900 Transcript_38681/m.78900 type:complete len:263 (+) Transcript_38681:901-1689(+)